MLRRVERPDVTTNYAGYYLSLQYSLRASAASLFETQAKCRAALARTVQSASVDMDEVELDDVWNQPPAPAFAVCCPQSPMAMPSRRRPFGELDGFAAFSEQNACPQSPVSMPSRRPPVLRAGSSESLS